MNRTIEMITRQKILEGLLNLPKRIDALFCAMYGRGFEPGKCTVQEVVAAMAVDKLDDALALIERTHGKRAQKAGEGVMAHYRRLKARVLVLDREALALEKERDRMRAALEFYAAESHLGIFTHRSHRDRARAALHPEKPEGE